MEYIIFGMVSIITIMLIVGKSDDTDKSFFKRSGLGLYTDHKTGLQYISAGFFGGISPRFDKDGNHMKIDDNFRS